MTGVRLINLDGPEGPLVVDVSRIVALEVVVERDRAGVIARYDDAGRRTPILDGAPKSIGTKIYLAGLTAPLTVSDDLPVVEQKMADAVDLHRS